MAENERFMDAIREDIMQGEEQAREEAGHEEESGDYGNEEEAEEAAALQRLRAGDDEDYPEDYDEDDGKLETVGEGNETN